MPPRSEAPGAIPLVLHARLSALRERHEVVLVTVVGADPGEALAVAQWRRSGLEVHANDLMPHGTAARWHRRWRLGSGWLAGRHPWRTLWFHEPGIQSTLDRLLTERQFDLVLVEDNAMAPYRYHTATPRLLVEHEVRRARPVAWMSRPPHGWRRLPQRILSELDWQRWPRYQRAVWQQFHRILVFTAEDAAAIEALSPEMAQRTRVSPFGIAMPAAALSPELEQEGHVVFVGNYTHWPNVDAALWLGREIMPALRARHPGASLSLVGIYPPAEVLALGAPDIQVTGPVPEIEPILARAAVVLAPVRVGGGMRMKVLQSMALGKAVVTTPRGAQGLSIDGHQPPLAVAEDAAAFALLTAELLASSEARSALGRQARAYVVEHFSAGACATRFEAIVAELASAPSGS